MLEAVFPTCLCLCGVEGTVPRGLQAASEAGEVAGSLLKAAGFQLMVGKKPQRRYLSFLTKLGFINGYFALRRTEELDFQDLFCSRICFLLHLAICFCKVCEYQCILLCTTDRYLFPISIYWINLVKNKLCFRPSQCTLCYLFTGWCFIFLLGFSSISIYWKAGGRQLCWGAALEQIKPG